MATGKNDTIMQIYNSMLVDRKNRMSIKTPTSSNTPSRRYDVYPDNNEYYEIAIPQMKAIPISLFIDDDFFPNPANLEKLTSDVRSFLNLIEGEYKQGDGFNIQFFLDVNYTDFIKNVSMHSNSSAIGGLISPNYIANSSLAKAKCADLILDYYKIYPKPDIKTFLVSSGTAECKSLGFTIVHPRYSGQAFVPKSKLINKIKEDIVTCKNNYFEHVLSNRMLTPELKQDLGNNTTPVYIDMHSGLVYFEQLIILKQETISTPISPIVNTLNAFLEYNAHIIKSAHLSLLTKRSSSVITGMLAQDALKELVVLTDIGAKFNYKVKDPALSTLLINTPPASCITIKSSSKL